MQGTGIISYSEAGPLPLCSGFLTQSVEGSEQVTAFLYKFGVGDFSFCVVSPSDLQFDEDVLTIYLSAEVTQRVTVTFCGVLGIPKNADSWELLYTAHLRWMAELYTISSSNLEFIKTRPRFVDTKSTYHIENMFKKMKNDGFLKNYLILPALHSATNRKPNTEQNCCHMGTIEGRDIYNSCLDMAFIKEIVENGFSRKIEKEQVCRPK